jgi:type I restriction enzyme S subunit
MRDRNLTNVAASVHARLMNRSRQTGEDFQFLLQRYGAERLLYRLGLSPYRDRFVLKGAMLFALWGGSVYRATRDLDFTGYGDPSEDAVRQCFREICTQPVEDDGLEFDTSTIHVEPILDEAEYNGVRVRFEARLGGARISMQVDVGFGNAIEPAARDEEYPTLLGGPAPRIRAYPVEAVVAEKLHAIHRFGETNSRLKDFYDLYVLSEQFEFDAELLQRAVAATFGRRATPIDSTLPAGLQPRFFADDARAGQWRAYLSRNELPGAPADFQVIGERLRAFLGPIWDSLANGSSANGTWHRGNGWSSGETSSGAGTVPGTAVESIAQVTAPIMSAARVAVAATSTSPIERPATTGLGRFKPYPAYKDSGVEWLGAIPAHWEVKRLKFVAAEPIKSGIGEAGAYDNPSWPRYVRITDIAGPRELREDSFASLPRELAQEAPFNVGDLLLVAVGATFGKSYLHVRDIGPVCFASYLVRFSPAPNVDATFAAYWTESSNYWALVQSRVVQSTVQNFSAAKFKELPIPLPPLLEQRAIATFLDRETARIDGLVEKKERLIALLQEKRTALISHAVTKGLDPTAPMKDSGVEWLGAIPAHWEVKRLKRLASVRLSNVDKKTLEGEEPVLLCNYIDVYKNERITRSLEFMPATASKEQKKQFALRAGDVLITKDSESWTDIAVPALVAEDLDGVVCGYHLAHIRPNRDCDGAFLSRVFAAIGPRDQFHVAANGITRYGLSSDAIRSAIIPLPPLPEQRAIAAFLDRETAKIDALIAKVREAIERLKEYRTALISAAVTGKIDVREAVSA